jgi:hypothetical protein
MEIEKCGLKWSAIAKAIPGRTENQVKNFYHGIIKTLQRKLVFIL